MAFRFEPDPDVRVEVYERTCLDAGIVPTEDGYWAWRESIARLSGVDDLELAARRIARAARDAGIAMTSLSDALALIGRSSRRVKLTRKRS